MPTDLDHGAATSPQLRPSEAWASSRHLVLPLVAVWGALSFLMPVMYRLGDPGLEEALIDASLVFGVSLSLGLFVLLILMGVALAGVGWRQLWSAPALAFQVGGVIPVLIGLAGQDAPWTVAAPIVAESLLSGWGPLVILGWFGGPVLLLLVLAPGFLVSRRRHPQLARPPFGWNEAAGLSAALLLVGMVTYLALTLSPYAMDIASVAVGLAPVVLFGAALGTAKGWWPWTHLTAGLVVAMTSGWTTILLVPLVLAAPMAALWQPIAHSMQTSSRRPLSVLIALNVLNAADAALTRFAVSTGMATEANPLVENVGMPVKLVLVAAASVVIFRVRPKALIWPTLALAVVAVWHVMGLIING